MKFVKIIINGEEYYRKVEDTAEDITAEDSEPVIEIDEDSAADTPETDTEDSADTDGEKEPTGAEKLRRDTEKFFERMGAGAREFSEKFDKGAKEFGDKFAKGARDLRDKFVDGIERLFNLDESSDPDSVDAKILKLLPYMSGDELIEVCERILANDKLVAKIDLGDVMPFLGEDMCDRFFIKGLEVGKDAEELVTSVPFVSETCLDGVTDDYIAGKYQDLEIERFYPFMSDANIKKIFYYIVGEENA